MDLADALRPFKKEWEKQQKAEKREKARIAAFNRKLRKRSKHRLRLCRSCGRLFELKKGMSRGEVAERGDSRGDGYLVKEWTVECPYRVCGKTITIRRQHLGPAPEPRIVRPGDMDSR